MATLGHLAAGLAAGRIHQQFGKTSGKATDNTGAADTANADTNDKDLGKWMLIFSALSFLPDLDVVAFAVGIPYEHPFGHRGATHSLVFAALIAVSVFLATKSKKTAFIALLVTASHGVLDACTNGGLGIAFLWPITAARYFAPWTPIPVAPIGLGMVSARGVFVLGAEIAMFLPVFAYALWPRGPVDPPVDFDG